MTSPYTPEFQFSDWPDGPLNANLPPDPLSPNAVLTQVETEFRSVATAIAQLSARIDELSAPSSRSVLLTLTPAFVAIAGLEPWIYDFGIAKKQPGVTRAVGLMPLQLPDGATVTSFRAKGTKAAGNLEITLQRGAMAPQDATRLAGIPEPPTGAFDLSDPFIAAHGPLTIDDNYRHWIVAGLINAPPSASAEIHGLQLTYVV
ncbi:hypothetical protein WEI85_35780 [Actinomycetes bacterium KLBMP 9797]